MKVSKTVILVALCGVIFLFGTNNSVAQYVDFLNPFTVDEYTVLLMHFDGDLTNVSTLSEDGEAEGRINFIQGLPNLGQAVWIDNDAPGIDTSMVVVSHSDALNLKTTFTIEGWSNNITFDVSGSGTARSRAPWIVRKGIEGGGNDAAYGIMVNPWTHNFEATTVYNDGFIEQIWCRLVTDHATVDLGVWYHFTFIKDFENKAKILMIHDTEGNLYQWAAALMPSDTTAYNDEPLFLGLCNQGWQDIGLFYWNGFIDELRISNVVRDYSAPPVIGDVGLVFEGHNPKANQTVQVKAEVRTIGGNTLDGVPVFHYETGDGNWQEMNMTQGDAPYLFVVDVPGQPKGTTVTYYVTAKNQEGLEGRYPQKYGNYAAIGYWDEYEQTLDITFEEGPPGPPQDYGIYKHEVIMLGENLTYTNDVPPALSSESNYSLAFNMDIDEELPDTCGLMIPEPTPYINGEYDADGNYGWTLEFWVKVDTSKEIRQWSMPARTGIITSQTPGHLMHRFDINVGEYWRLRFYQYWAQLVVPLPGINTSGKWFHAMIGETQDLYFARFYNENDSLVAHGIESKLQWGPFDPPYSTINVFLGHSWKGGDYIGLMDNIKWYNYPKDLPPTFYDVQAVNALEDQPLGARGTITHPGTIIDNVKLHYTLSSTPGQWQTLDMNLESGATYSVEIPAQPMGTIVQYYLSAEATNGLRSTSPGYAESQNDYLSNAWWRANTQTLDLTFEEGPNGPPVDDSDYQQPLILYGNPQYSDDAIDGNYSLAFDGEATYIEIDPAPLFASKEFTVDFWFKADSSIDKGVRFILQESDADWDEGPFHIQSRGDKIRDDVYIKGAAGIYRVRFDLGTKFEPGKWYRHILDVGADSAFAELRDSSNVILERQSTDIEGHPVLEDGPFRLGAGQPDQGFTGKMDNVRIYNYSVASTGTKVAKHPKEKPVRFSLWQNYPNPFNPTTTIKYSIPPAEQVSLIIYDVLGRQVKELVNGKMSAGEHLIHWDGKNSDDNDVASGVYFYQLEVKNKGVTKMQVRKMALVR